MGHTPRKAIKLPHQHTVKGMVTGRSHQRLELRASLLATRDGDIQILRHNLQLGTRCIEVEAIGLEIRLLVDCRDTQVEGRMHTDVPQGMIVLALPSGCQQTVTSAHAKSSSLPVITPQ